MDIPNDWDIQHMADGQLVALAKRITEEQTRRKDAYREEKRKAILKALEEFFDAGGEIYYETYEYDVTINSLNQISVGF